MDDIFEHEPSMQTCLMKVYQEFLATEEDRLERNEQGNVRFIFAATTHAHM